MKRIVTLTAVLMFAGMGSLILAHENMNSSTSAPAVESMPAANTAPAATKPAANVESAKQPVAANSKSEVLPSKEGTTASHSMAQGSPAVTGKTEKKETSSVTTTSNSKEKKAEQKPNEVQTTTNPTK